MGMSDPIADMLTRIRNANRVRQRSTDVMLSKMNLSIAKVLKKAGYINGYDVKKDGVTKRNVLRVYLKYTDSKARVITDLQRISKPGRRIYVGSQKIPKVLYGYGVAILSTPKGVIPDTEARAKNVGGELLCKVW